MLCLRSLGLLKQSCFNGRVLGSCRGKSVNNATWFGGQLFENLIQDNQCAIFGWDQQLQ